MTGIDKITNRIMREAEESAQKTIEEAKADAAALLEQAEKQAEAKASNLLAVAHRQADQLEKRTISVGELEARKLRLSAKQDMIDTCFEKALDQLCSMETSAYIDMLTSMVCQVLESDGEIKLNAADGKTIGAELINQVNKQTEEKGRHHVALSKETIKARGGFVLQCGQVEVNCRLETLVESLRGELIPQVAVVLFD